MKAGRAISTECVLKNVPTPAPVPVSLSATRTNALLEVIALQLHVTVQISIRLEERDLVGIERIAKVLGAKRTQVIAAFIREGLNRG